MDQLVKCIGSKPVLTYFDVNKPTELLVDASPVGVSGMLVQREKGIPKVVAYGSRSLTYTEQRYSQLEREALAIVWSCEHFHIYVYGRPLTVYTDHQPLLSLFGKPQSKLPMRLERWSLRLQPYSPVIKYQRGADNPADYLSRHPLSMSEQKPVSDEEMLAEQYVNFISKAVIPKAMSYQEVRDASVNDPTFSALRKLIEDNQWYKVKKPELFSTDVDMDALKAFRIVSAELSTNADGVIFRGTRLVLPKKLNSQAVSIAHEGHQGISRTKALLREKIWFPGIDSLVENAIKGCVSCQANYDPKRREPLQMTTLPSRPWQAVSVDFYGPLPSGHSLLVTRDDYSRFPVVDVLSSQSARATIPALESLFASRGIPEKLRSDNGTPFQSEEFANFSKDQGFEHIRVTPYWPEANGGVERFMRTLGKTVKCAQLDGKPWKKELNKFLMNYRATPHCVIGVPPATLLNAYPMRVKLPEVVSPVNDDELRHRDKVAKAKMKSYAESRRNIKQCQIKEGDKVLMKNVTKFGKLVPKFQSQPFEVIEKRGSMIIAKRGNEVKARNSSHFRPILTDVNPLLDFETDEREVINDPVPVVSVTPSVNVVPRSQPGVVPNSPHPPPTVVPIATRRSQRVITAPKRLADYELSQVCLDK
jgi:hypothetical protein